MVLLFVIEIASALISGSLDSFFFDGYWDRRWDPKAKGNLRLTFRNIGEALPSLVAANISVLDLRMLLARLAKLDMYKELDLYDEFYLTPGRMIQMFADDVARRARKEKRKTSDVLRELLALDNHKLVKTIKDMVRIDSCDRIEQLRCTMAREEEAVKKEAYIESIENWADHKWLGAKLRV